MFDNTEETDTEHVRQEDSDVDDSGLKKPKSKAHKKDNAFLKTPTVSKSLLPLKGLLKPHNE
jgi:hypothetical protein